jgi:Uma2 family endonuclease
MTLEQWADLPEDEEGELVDGHLEEEEMPDFVHELIVVFLTSAFDAWIAARGGFVGGSEAKFAVRPNRGQKPDLSVYLPGRKPQPRGLVHVPPDIVVEVVTDTPSDRRRDRIAKLDEYAAFGARFYWIVEPEERALEVFELGADGRYARALGVTGGRIAPPGCEGLTIDLDAMWARVDALLAE